MTVRKPRQAATGNGAGVGKATATTAPSEALRGAPRQLRRGCCLASGGTRVMDKMNQYEEFYIYIVRVFGSFMGVLASLVIVAPLSMKHAFYRGLVGVSMGTVFAPVIQNMPMLGWFHGESLEFVIARAALCGFVVYFILEITARLLSSEKVITVLVDELIRLRKK